MDGATSHIMGHKYKARLEQMVVFQVEWDHRITLKNDYHRAKPSKVSSRLTPVLTPIDSKFVPVQRLY